MAPAALSILAVNFPEGQERNRALGIFGAVAGISASVGVIASGLLTDGPGWRWVFFINVPVGVLLSGLAALFLAADLLPAFLLAGIGVGLCAPSVQIGALSGVSDSASGLASGLVETMREIGGAAGVAAVSTVLVSRTGLNGFHAAFTVISIAAALGALTAATGFPRSARPAEQPAPDAHPQTGDEPLVPIPSPRQPALRGMTWRTP